MPLSLDAQLAWWLSSLSGSDVHHLDTKVMWHARLMVLAWGVLLPMGVIAARYYKVTPGQDWPKVVDNRAWWHAHQATQYSGVVIMLAGLWLVWGVGSGASLAARWHGWAGYIVTSLGVAQVLSAWFRGSKGGPSEPQMRGDHYDMTTHRRWFEALHKRLGWLAIGLAVATIGLGLVASDAPRWMALVLGFWLIALLAMATHLERSGRHVATYQAIWGVDPKHPGNAGLSPTPTPAARYKQENP